MSEIRCEQQIVFCYQDVNTKFRSYVLHVFVQYIGQNMHSIINLICIRPHVFQHFYFGIILGR